MSEVEFEQLLNAVSVAIGPSAQDDILWDMSDFDDLPPAANDNQIAWPLIPFPAGWYAAC